jgi:hypothetical protein
MASTYLTRTLAGNGNQYTATFSVWLKRSSFANDSRVYTSWYDANNQGWITFTNNTIGFFIYQSSSYSVQVRTNRLFRDCCAWYHVVFAIDTTQSTASDRVKIYINGTQETSMAQTDYPAQNQSLPFGLSSYNQRIGTRNNDDNFDGSMTHFHFVDGTAYPASTFGETDSTSGIWVPKTNPSVTYGSNGFFLKFGNSAAMGTDSSGNSNTWTVNGTLTQINDTPNNNFATLNPAPSVEILSSAFYEYGGTNCRSSTANFIAGVSGVYLDQGKWYFEMQTATADCHIGIAGEDKIMNGGTSGGVNNRLFYYEDTTGYAYSYNGPNGQIYFSTPSDGTQTATYGNTFSSSDTIGCFADLDNNKLYFSKNGTIQNSGTGYDIQDGIYYAFGTAVYQSDTSLNFGNGTFKGVKLTGTTYSDANGEGIFKYSPNQGGASNFDSSAKNFYALCTKNIKEFG